MLDRYFKLKLNCLPLKYQGMASPAEELAYLIYMNLPLMSGTNSFF